MVDKRLYMLVRNAENSQLAYSDDTPATGFGQTGNSPRVLVFQLF
jgi:hypothetical protein